MSCGELELLSVLARGSQETFIYSKAVQTPNALPRGEFLSFICPHFPLPECDEGLRRGGKPSIWALMPHTMVSETQGRHPGTYPQHTYTRQMFGSRSSQSRVRGL